MRFLVGGTVAVAAGQVVLIVFGRALFPPEPRTEYVVTSPAEHTRAVQDRWRAESRAMALEGENFGLRVDNVLLRDQLRRVHIRDGGPAIAPPAIPVAEVEPGDLIPPQSVPTVPVEAP